MDRQQERLTDAYEYRAARLARGLPSGLRRGARTAGLAAAAAATPAPARRPVWIG